MSEELAPQLTRRQTTVGRSLRGAWAEWASWAVSGHHTSPGSGCASEPSITCASDLAAPPWLQVSRCPAACHL